MDKCDVCGKRVAKDIQICLSCFRKYKENRKKLEAESLKEIKGNVGPV